MARRAHLDMDADLIEIISDLSRGAIVVFDGFCGSGKTSLAQKISRKLNIQHIDSDCYIIKQSDTESYTLLLDIEHLKEIIETFIKRKKTVLFSGICAQETLGMLGVDPDYRVYVKKISSSGIWHDGLHIEEFINHEEPSGYYLQQPNKSDMEYHVKYEPQNKADFVHEHIRD